MRKNNKQVTTYFILFSLLLIGVVYAILQANLQINGIAKIQANTWDIHFENIVVNENSVSIGENDSQATIDSENNCKVDFEVTLSIPGDFYEFTIDVVNAGTIDGMIGNLNKTLKVNNEVVSEIPDYLDYSVTYEDGVEIEDNHKLEAGTTETYLVRLEFKTDIEELPEATTVLTTLEPQYIQADSSATEVFHTNRLYNIIAAEYNSGSGLVHEYTGEHKDSFTQAGIKKIYHWYASSNDNANIILEKWNVLFGGFCWQMWRTTDTGGIKLMYNGVPSDGKCTATGTGQQIGTSAYNTKDNSPAYAGYMYNPTNLITYVSKYSPGSGTLFGTGVTYSGGTYMLTNTSTTYDESHRYTCNNTTGSCSTVKYHYYVSSYTELNDGRNIEEALEDMLWDDNVNQTNSAIKATVDTWYQNNMTAYTSKLEDTIFCNARGISNYGGWNPNGGSETALQFETCTSLSGLSCTNITDQFSIYNSKAQLTYPVGLMTIDEGHLLNNVILKKTDQNYWLISAYSFSNDEVKGRVIGTAGGTGNAKITNSLGVRPAISLKPGTKATSGDGSKNNPYIVE